MADVLGEGDPTVEGAVGASYSGVKSIMGGSERGWEGSQRIGSPFERESLDNERSPVNITSHVILYE